MANADVVAEGRRAFERRAWTDAYEQLSAADRAGGIEPDDLERLATAAYLTGHDEASSDALTRAHHAWLDRGSLEPAVRCAFWAGFGLVQRGEMAQGGGWLGRARRLVEEQQLDCAESGYLLIPDALMAIDAGDFSAAQARCEEVAAVAQRFGDADLAAFGLLGRGQALLCQGRVSEGCGLFDEAMVSVTAGEVSPVVSGIVYCAVIDECQQVLDIRRAHEWTAALDRWCEAQPDLVPYRGQCLVHRSQVMQLRGAWSDAIVEAERACERLAEPPHPAIGMAHYQLGELHRLRGDLAAAERAYRRAHDSGRDPQPGLALLRVAQSRVPDATAAIAHTVDDADDAVRRSTLLPAAVEIMLAADRVAEARAAADELSRLAAGADAALLRATAAHCEGAVLIAEGQSRAALDSLRDAWQTWQELAAPYEAAQTRILIGMACRAVDDHDTASLECEAARKAFEKLGAGPALARLEEIFGPDGRARADRMVTEREVEVLREVAAGRTNREIAGKLVISEKTVERHLSNIFTKLGVSNRAGATAYAYDHHLV